MDTTGLDILAQKGYKLEKKLNAGAFGEVFAAVASNGDRVAIKVISFKTLSDEIREVFLPREMCALIFSRHQFIVPVYDIVRTEEKIYTFLEYCNMGDLFNYIVRHGYVSQALAMLWFYQISNAIDYLHNKMDVAHRDIKLENVLLNDMIAKVTDLGFAKCCRDNQTNSVVMSNTFCGTPGYMSPELLYQVPYNPFLADVWALGVCMYIMINGCYPYNSDDPKLMLEEIKERLHDKRYRQGIHDHVRWFTNKMLVYDPQKRPDVKVIMKYYSDNKYKTNLEWFPISAEEGELG